MIIFEEARRARYEHNSDEDEGHYEDHVHQPADFLSEILADHVAHARAFFPNGQHAGDEIVSAPNEDSAEHDPQERGRPPQRPWMAPYTGPKPAMLRIRVILEPLGAGWKEIRAER